jgi:hypothetical protein
MHFVPKGTGDSIIFISFEAGATGLKGTERKSEACLTRCPHFRVVRDKSVDRHLLEHVPEQPRKYGEYVHLLD